MKKLLQTIILLALIPIAHAKDNAADIQMTLKCFAHDATIALEEGYGELPFVQGNGDINMGNDRSIPIEMTLHVNPDNKSWTLMYKLGEKLNCVAAGGAGTFRPAGIEPDGVEM